MTVKLRVGETFPDVELSNHRHQTTRLSQLTKPSLMDQKLGFRDGYPLIVVFYRGFFCPRDQQQMRQFVQFQDELKVNYCKLVTISVDPPGVQAAFRAGLGASWTFLSDEARTVVKDLNILDETEGEYAYRAQPYVFVLRPDLSIYKLYNGWFFVGRPTLEELRRDLRAVMETFSNYSYEAYDTPQARQLRIPQQTWAEGAPPLGESGLPVVQGTVRWFDDSAGYGMILRDDTAEEVFVHFTAIPGEGYRRLTPGSAVRFELVQTETATVARNVQEVGSSDD